MTETWDIPLDGDEPEIACEKCRYYSHGLKICDDDYTKYQKCVGQCQFFPAAVDKSPYDWCGQFKDIDKSQLN